MAATTAKKTGTTSTTAKKTGTAAKKTSTASAAAKKTSTTSAAAKKKTSTTSAAAKKKTSTTSAAAKKKTTTTSTAAKKKTTAASAANTGVKLNETEKKLIKLYRAADAKTRKEAMQILEEPKSDLGNMVSSLLNNKAVKDVVSGLLKS